MAALPVMCPHNNSSGWSNQYEREVLEMCRVFRISSDDYLDVLSRWLEPHRFYHGINHLIFILDKIRDEKIENTRDRLILVAAAFFHDAIYDVNSSTNERDSAELFLKYSSDNDSRLVVYDIILDTTHTKPPQTKISELFCKFDIWNILHGSIADLINDERNIFLEYQRFDYSLYKEKRIDVMTNFQVKGGNPDFSAYLRYLANRKIRVGIYPGTFNPFHVGHLNILLQAEKLFDKVIIAIGKNPAKSAEYNIKIHRGHVADTLQYRQVESFDGLLSEYVSSKNYDCTIIRGLRNGTDLEYERTQLAYLRDIDRDLKFVFIPCEPQFEHVSSSGVRYLMSGTSWREAEKYLITTPY